MNAATFIIDAGVTPDWKRVRRAIDDLTIAKFDARYDTNREQREDETESMVASGEITATSELGQSEQWLEHQKTHLREALDYIQEMLNVGTEDMDVRTFRDVDVYLVWEHSDQSELWYRWEALETSGVIYAAGFDPPEDQ